MNRSKSKHIFLRGYLIYRLVVLVCFFAKFRMMIQNVPPIFQGDTIHQSQYARNMRGAWEIFPFLRGMVIPQFLGVYIYIYPPVN